MIGRHVIGSLLARGAKVRVLVRPSSRALNLRGLAVERLMGDLADPKAVAGLLSGSDLLFHCAAPYPRSHFGKKRQVESAAAGLASLFRIARSFVPGQLLRSRPEAPLHPPLREVLGLAGLKRIVFVSSSTTIGRARVEPGAQPRPARESDRHDRIEGSSPYFAMKEAMEAVATREAAGGLPVVIGNPTLCVDAHDATPTTGKLLLTVGRRGLPFYFNGVANVVPTRDVGEALVNAAALGQTGQRYILGGENMTVRRFLEMSAEAAGVPAPKIPLPLVLAEGIAFLTELANLALRRPWPLLPVSGVQMLRYSQPFDCTLAREELRMPATPIKRAVEDAYTWFRENGYL